MAPPKCPGGPRPAVCASGAVIRHLLGALAEDVGLALGQYPARKGSVSASFFSGGQLARERDRGTLDRQRPPRVPGTLPSLSRRPKPSAAVTAPITAGQPALRRGWRRRTSSREAGGTTGTTGLDRRSGGLVLYVTSDSTCWPAPDPPGFRGNQCRRVLTPPADNHTLPFLIGAESAVRRSVSRWSARRRSLWPNDLDTRRRTATIAAPRKGTHPASGSSSR